MAGTIKLEVGSIQTLESSGGSLSSGSEVAATTTYDNSSNLYFRGSFELNGGFGSAPTVGVTVDLYLVPALDGSNYAEVDTTNHRLQADHYVGSFVVLKSQTGSQRMTLSNIPLPHALFKAYLLNNAGQTLSSTWTLKMVPAREQYT